MAKNTKKEGCREKKCSRCSLLIKENDKGVSWITFKGKKVLEEVHFHWKCFLEWRNESLENRAKKLYFDSMSKALPQFKKLIGQISDGKTNTGEIC